MTDSRERRFSFTRSTSHESSSAISPMAEKGLAEDAPWKVMQKNTFTRWANEHLKQADTRIDNLEYDLSDGLRLISLVEVLTSHKFQQINKKPTFRTQKLENVTRVLSFLEEKEHLRLVNIDSTDIVDHNLKLILGLIWTLIMRYSISFPLYDSEGSTKQLTGASDNSSDGRKLREDQQRSPTNPKQRLLEWIQQKISPVPVKNFTTDWNSGVLIGALVDSCSPGLCPDWVYWDGRQPLKNTTEAMTVAEEWLGVPQLINPEDLINCNVDEKSVMTYLSQFLNANLKTGAPLRPRLDPTKIICFGSGLEEKGNRMGRPCHFTVETANAGSGDLEISVLNPRGVKEQCQVVHSQDKQYTYSCTYDPTMEGLYKIIVKYSGHEVPGSPFNVLIGSAPADVNKVVVTGPGVTSSANNRVGRPTHFNVITKDAGSGDLECIICDPNGRRDKIRPKITCPNGDGMYLVEFIPSEVGTHKILVNFDGQLVSKAPFIVEVGPQYNSEAAYARGRGVKGCGVRVQDKAVFQVHTERCGGEAVVTATMVRPDGEAEPVSVVRKEKYLWDCSYVPRRPGKYTLVVHYGDDNIQDSPFEIVVSPYKEFPVVAFGPGLVAGVVNKPNMFTVSSKEQINKINFSIDGPSEARIGCNNLGDGTAHVTYTVTNPGEYAIHITYDGEDISQSPYTPYISPNNEDIKADRVQIVGPGVTESDIGLPVGKPTEFYIEGVAEALPSSLYRSLSEQTVDSVLRVDCVDANGHPVRVQCRRSGSTFVYSYTPTTRGVHTVYATLGHIPLRGVPFRVRVLSQPRPEKVRLWGSGLTECIQRQRNHFFIDPRAAFPEDEVTAGLLSNPVTVRISDSHGHHLPTELTKLPDGTYRVEYTVDPGVSDVLVNLSLGDTPIRSDALHVPVRPSLSEDDVKVIDLESKVFLSSYVKFTVDASAIDPDGQGDVAAILISPNKERLACQTVNNKNGTYTCIYAPTHRGAHQIEVFYEGIHVPGSPFDVQVVFGSDPSRVKVYGPGLKNGPHLCPGVPTEFTVDLVGAGKGGIGLSVEGPEQAPIECRDNRDGTCTVQYTPKEPGTYAICVRFNDTNVAPSPFYVDVRAKVDPSKVRCYGPGLEPDIPRAGWPADFTVDTKKAGDARLEVLYTPKPGSEPRTASIQPLGAAAGLDLSQPANYYKVTFTPESEGICYVTVLYDGKHVPGSPFPVQVRKSCEPERVRVYGLGVEGPVSTSFPVTFTVDARDAGMGDLTLDISDPNGQSVPVRVIPLPVDSESVVTNGAVPSVTSLASGDVSDTGLLLCTYEPYVAGLHTVHVIFARVEVENSPFSVLAVPSGQAHLCQIKDTIPEVVEVDVEQSITVDTCGDENGRLTCQVVQPASEHGDSASLLPVESVDNKDGTVCVYYRPKQLGEVQVELRFGGQLIPGGEFTQKVITKEELESRSKRTPTYRPVEFRFPAPKGNGKIEAVVVLPSEKQQPLVPTINDDDTITIIYHPEEKGMHDLHVNSITPVRPGDTLSSSVAMPIQGSPYRFYVDTVSIGRVSAFGPGLSHGVTNQPATFTIMAQEAGGGGLSLSVEGPSKAEIKCTENGDGTCDVSYLPLAPGKYTISIRFHDQHIAGSPFVAKITGDELKRAQLNLGAPNGIVLEDLSHDIATLTASAVSASGREAPCVLKRLPNNRLGISFTPEEPGEHIISVYHAGEHIADSPFRMQISENEVGDPRRVLASGPGLKTGYSNQPNQFTVDTRDAGYSGLNLSIVGPSKVAIECYDQRNGTYSVIYTPTEPGPYVINVVFADMHIPNSPFHVNVQGDSPTQITEQITQRREASSITTVGSRCELSLRVADTKLRDISAFVHAPSGQTVPCEIIPVELDHYNIKFVPQEMGEHLVFVKHKGINIAGSPFQFTVGPITDGMAAKVRATGPGLLHALANEVNEFTVYTREAGAGTLAIAIEGPSKADIECEERPDGSSIVSYRVAQPGTYTCSVKFNDEHIPLSPFRIDVENSNVTDRVSYALHSTFSGARSILEAATSPDDNLPVQLGRSITFTVHHEEIGGEVLRAQVRCPSGSIEDALVQTIGQDQYAIRFMPTESGVHSAHVHVVPIEMARQSNIKLGPDSPFRSIQGSPFRLVISRDTADAGMVCASGEGLYRGRVGQKNSFFVNTANAGTGVLNVTVDGPSKVNLSTEERDEGYLFSYEANVPGTYEITIKYGGTSSHIAGSPFKAIISGSGHQMCTGERIIEEQSQIMLKTVDKTRTAYQGSEMQIYSSGTNAAMVRCHGLGLKRLDSEHSNHFSIDASDAGYGILLVGVCGPTRPFEEIKIQHLKNNKYSVSYRVEESGRHIIVVKWQGQDVPGSPFVVDVP